MGIVTAALVVLVASASWVAEAQEKKATKSMDKAATTKEAIGTADTTSAVSVHAERRQGLREEIRQQVKKIVPSIVDCYKARLTERPELHGNLYVDWEVDDRGKVSIASVNEKRTTIQDKPLHDCVIAKIKATQFHPAENGQTISVSFPFKFDF